MWSAAAFILRTSRTIFQRKATSRDAMDHHWAENIGWSKFDKRRAKE
jgi:hypothetical protein